MPFSCWLVHSSLTVPLMSHPRRGDEAKLIQSYLHVIHRLFTPAASKFAIACPERWHSMPLAHAITADGPAMKSIRRLLKLRDPHDLRLVLEADGVELRDAIVGDAL